MIKKNQRNAIYQINVLGKIFKTLLFFMFKFESPAQFITVSVDRKENGSIHAKESIDMRVIIFQKITSYVVQKLFIIEVKNLSTYREPFTVPLFHSIRIHLYKHM